jgi:4-hydroxybenzoate polyprenyltransferase
LEGFLIGFFMFLGLVIGSLITDIDGYSEDVRAGVKTIYTSIGLERANRLVAALIFVAALTPLTLFQWPLDGLVFGVLGAAASALFLREGRSRPVMIVALVGLSYAAFRYLGLLSLT